ncbi:VCBS repeat-containing protein [Aliifodinibius sp. S!AR15-10]|uniref:VCBS repeat-containing protein n=1 Tax=Aliifodinibius sp. S!AR15-10 TaxID=2950437 RepID=UPI002865A288|nr:VCBS repeat-containing protein [Aliifodinibius sp. S!AR15-10]MDR8392519.1 VCBS repeat-containing protein [Aliifodinibius sp. S!AR15-10]
MIHRVVLLAVSLSLVALAGCGREENAGTNSNALFKLLPSSQTNVTFSNDLTFDPEFNIYRYRNYYNGGGVAVGDINNDGLQDLYFTSNMEENKLYLNKGNMSFEDITDKAGVAGTRAWSTGVSMVDINGDGLLDIYVCNSGIIEGDDKRNELFINNGDSTFTERAAEYGIDDPALSIHGSFFDYDQDGDLDLYLVNNSFRAIGSFDLEENNRGTSDSQGGDKLYRNEGGRFVEVTEEAGIYNSEIGFGLGVSVADINRDGWSDMYISNDFFERDYLYINNRDGTFREVLEEQINSISAASMGADVADLSGDGYPEIFVTDMLPEREERLKKVTTFDDWANYRNYVENDYFHQFTRNTLQLNNTDGTFSEVGRWAGVEATDWSWGANIADLDMDGRRDIFVANGIYQDITNLDYLEKISKEDMVRRIVSDQNVDFKRLIEMVPSTPIANYAFQNRGNMQFADSTGAWGLDQPGFSNGSAYGDLDNDGDLDLVINNLNSEASIYENRVTQIRPENHWLMVDIKGTAQNSNALGAQLTAWADGKHWFAEQMPIRGFQSTMDSRIHFGLGKAISKLDSLMIRWPQGQKTLHYNLPVDTLLAFDVEKIGESYKFVTPQNDKAPPKPYIQKIQANQILDWKHRENGFVDFKRDKLLFHMRSTEGPPVCSADVNRDGLKDLYLGGAKDQPGTVFLQQENGQFSSTSNEAIASDRQSEDTACTWFDAEGDGDPDLYVASGGNEFPASSSALGDRLYINDGNGSFIKSQQPLPGWQYESSSTVSAADYDGDGDIDLFVGVRLRPFAVGTKVRGYLLANDGNGQFEDVTKQAAPALMETGMITDAQWGDVDNDKDLDLLLAGEWMPLTLFKNENGSLQKVNTTAGLDSTDGWWKSVLFYDLDRDGDLDFVAGNHGLNSRFEASKEKPAQLWTGDFDQSGTVEQVLTIQKDGEAYPMALRHNLIDQIPSLESKYPDYESFAGENVHDIFSKEMLDNSDHSVAYQLASVVGWNMGSGSFQIEELPMEAQLSPMYGIYAGDLNGDEKTEILMGGNLHNVKPEIGIYDASYGVTITVNKGELTPVEPGLSGFKTEGEIRKIIELNGLGKPVLFIARNDDTPILFEMRNQR